MLFTVGIEEAENYVRLNAIPAEHTYARLDMKEPASVEDSKKEYENLGGKSHHPKTGVTNSETGEVTVYEQVS